MQESQLALSFPFWTLFLCLLLGVFYAWILYPFTELKSKTFKRTLFLLRAVVIFLIAFLLLEPLFKTTFSIKEKPILALVVDNSSSIALVWDKDKINASIASILNLKNNRDLEEKYEIHLLTQNTKMDSSSFAYQATSSDLADLLSKPFQNFESKRLKTVVLFTDGIYNQGNNPCHQIYPFPVYTVGLGDSTSVQDLILKKLFYNKTNYLNQISIIQAEIKAQGYLDQTIEVKLINDNKVLQTQTLTIKKKQELLKIEFKIMPIQIGMKEYQVAITPLVSERTDKNNISKAYLENLNQKQKVLLAAFCPHPDLKAIKNAIESNPNFEVELHIADWKNLKFSKYDLAILHQIPNDLNIGFDLIEKLVSKKTPICFWVGAQSSLTKLNQNQSLLNLTGSFNRADAVTPSFSNKFKKFEFIDLLQTNFSNVPPILVPFGDTKLNPSAEAFLFQQIGNTTTEKVLAAVGTQNGKNAIVLGEGYWQWRLFEQSQPQITPNFDVLFDKLFQWLSAKEDKRKFKITPFQNRFQNDQTPILETEIYNDLNERIYNQTIELQITYSKGKKLNFQYTNFENVKGFEVPFNMPGTYLYKGKVKIGNEIFETSGIFSIEKNEIEALELQANFEILRELSYKTKGKFYPYQDFEKLKSELLSRNDAGFVRSESKFISINKLWWILALILALIATEWTIRKIKNEY